MSTQTHQQNSAARIERAVTIRILRGEYQPGTRLPTVRALAAQFGVNPATAQRALARLERTGLVTARQGSGIEVHDPETKGDMSLLPAWLEALADQPPQASSLLAEFLEVRRIVASRLVVRHRARLFQHGEALREAAQRLADTPPHDTDALRAADIAFARVLLQATGNRAALTILNAAARLLEEVPEVAEAMYADPAANARSMQEVLAALVSNQEEGVLSGQVEEVLATVDARTVMRYRALLEARQPPSQRATTQRPATQKPSRETT